MTQKRNKDSSKQPCNTDNYIKTQLKKGKKNRGYKKIRKILLSQLTPITQNPSPRVNITRSQQNPSRKTESPKPRFNQT
jgi:hypothetical protein